MLKTLNSSDDNSDCGSGVAFGNAIYVDRPDAIQKASHREEICNRRGGVAVTAVLAGECVHLVVHA